jgi:hypothetical protein
VTASKSSAARWWRSACNSSDSGRGRLRCLGAPPPPPAASWENRTPARGRVVFRQLHQQQRARHAEGFRDFRTRQERIERLQSFADVLAALLGQRAHLLACRRQRRSEQIGESHAHVRHRRHHRHAEPLRQRPGVDVDALLARLVHAVEGDHQRPAEQRQFQAEFEVTFQGSCIDHLQQHVRRAEGRRRLLRLVARDHRPAVTPEEDHQHLPVGLAQVMQGFDRGQVDQRDFLEADADQAFFVGRFAGQACMAGGRAGGGAEDAALAGLLPADEGDARPPFAAQQRRMQRDAARAGGGIHLTDYRLLAGSVQPPGSRRRSKPAPVRRGRGAGPAGNSGQ